MKQMWNSFLQSVIQFVNALFVNVSERMRHSASLMTAGISVVTVLTLTAGDLQGGGRNTLVAFAETPEQTEGVETELEEADSDELAADKEHSDQTETEAETAVEETVENETEETVEAENTESTEPETEEVPVSDENGEAESTGGSLAEEGKRDTVHENEPEEEDKEADGEKADEVIVLSDKEYNILLRIVQAEAGGCDEKGRVLVANVILNRVESDEFPDTVSGVVYQKSQFSPVIDGSINTCKVTRKTIDAVDRALQGEDYSDGALYFMNRSRSSSRNVHWFDTKLDYLFKHGEHEFFK